MVMINGEAWKICFVSSKDPMLFRSDGSLTLGSCDYSIKTIFIADNLTDKKLKKVLCHELTHAAMFSYDVSLTLEQEELLADLIATYGEEIVSITNKVFAKLKRGRY